MKHQIYFPSTLSAQVLWLMQFRKEFPLAAAQLNVQQSDIDSILIDIEWLVYGLRGLRSPLVHLTKAVTDDSFTALLIEPGMQIRAFVASNVALSFTGGLTLGLADAEGVALTAQPVGSAGVHYYFF